MTFFSNLSTYPYDPTSKFRKKKLAMIKRHSGQLKKEIAKTAIDVFIVFTVLAVNVIHF